MNRRLYNTGSFLVAYKFLSILLIVSFFFGNLGALFNFNTAEKAEAAQVTIDSAADVTGASHIHGASQSVFISDQVGYKFYRDAPGYCVYKKTSDGGSTWSSTTTVDAQIDCVGISVWYDRWTPGDTGTNIHIVTIDTGNDDPWYNRLDTNGDTRLLGSAPVSAILGPPAQGANTFTALSNYPAITKGTDGTVYIAVSDNVDSYIVECSITCQTAANWTETGPTGTLPATPDFNLLVPLASGNIMLINRLIASEDIRSKIWNNTAWSGTWTVIEGNGTDNTTYPVGMAATVSSTTPGNVYLAYVASNATLGTDDQVRTHRYTGGAWATTTSVLTGTTRGLTNVAIALDASNDDVYVAYTGRTTATASSTGNVYWKKSLDDMATWSVESPVINTTSNDMYGVDLNISSNERIQATWFDNARDDIYTDTIADVFSGIHATTTGSHTGSATASTSNFYVGGAFVLSQNYKTQDITDITITENGTIDGDANISNIKLFYEMDTTLPYNCASVSYGGGESQFGSTDTSGFSGPNGVSTFSGTTVSVGTTSTMCGYVVLDILNSTPNGSTIDLSINNPATDVTVTNGTAGPPTAQTMTGATTVTNDNLTQIRYHWRNDDNTEALATSKTGGTEGISFSGYQRTPVRLRMEVSNEGGASSLATQYRLEYSLATTSCNLATGWTDVGASNGDFDMSPSANLTDGNDTTNIAVAQGGVTNENTTFLTPNGGVKDTSSQTGNITLSTTQYVELEYSIIASTTAADGNTYCMRLTNAGTPLDTYSVYPQVTIQADVNLTTRLTQTANLNVPSTNQNVGGQFVLTDATGSHTITSIKLTENGTVNAQTGLDNIRLKYDFDTTAPYDCASESYGGSEAQFGATSTASFSGTNGTTTFSGSLGVTTTQTVCMYTVLDVTTSASNGQTVEVEISNATTDATLTSGSSAPSSARALPGTTTLVGAVLTQSRYHFRADNGTEAAATSLTGGNENTALTNVSQNTPVRIRMEVSNEGTITSPNTALRLEFGTKISTCSAVASWTDVGATLGAFDMFASANLTEGGNTTNIATGIGGVTDDNTTFKTPNASVKDTSSQIATTTFLSTNFIETEFSVKQTANAAYDTTYCFRLSNAGTALQAYTAYPELTTSPERDFEIQRGVANFSATSVTLTAGVDYIAPSASTSAFVRITNSHYTGAGDSSAGGNSNADDVTAYISNPSNLVTSFTITRPATAIATTTRVAWEIVEFIGTPGSDNEMKVRGNGTVTYTTTSITATGTAVTGIVNDADVVVFITGQDNPDILTTDYNTGQSVSQWLSASDQPSFRRGEASGDASRISYAVVEFTGVNWKVQRASHTYTAAGTTETESITAVNSLSRTFIHSQKRMGTALQGEDEFGHEVWLSSIGAVSFFLQGGATSPALQTSVAWIIENTQTSNGAMVVTQKNNFTNGGAEPLTLSMPIDITLDDLTNTSIFATNRAVGTGTLFPRPIAGFRIASTTHFEIWRSDTGTQIDYRVEIVQWPTAGLALHQNDYRFYVDNNALDPTDPWPLGVIDLGENTVLTGSDEPLGDAEHIRIRMSATVFNATLPEDTVSNKLQFGERITTCTAIGEINWIDIGNATSSAIWRGYNASGVVDGTTLSTDPPTGGELNITASDIGGTYEETNNSAVNPYTVEEGEDIEYDWHIQQNGADAETFYCFRMVDSSGSVFGAYDDYPQLRTSSFTAKTQNWRWYSDANNETPTQALAIENSAPIDIGNGSTTKLRVTVKETENIARDDVRFKLQYSEYADFSNNVYDVLATSTCIASSTWCYFNGGGSDNAVISTKVLSDADACVAGVGDGCGTHNESSQLLTGFRHENSAATEYEFTLEAKALRANAVYYFRLYDITQDIPVLINTGESYPSLVAVGASLVFDVAGITSGTVIDSFTVDVTSTPTAIPFGTVPFNTDFEAAYRLNINTNATQGYQVLMYADQQLLNSYGTQIQPITATNATPAGWNDLTFGCLPSSFGCFGYHAEDDSLSGINGPRFGADDTFAQLSTTTPHEVMYSSIPVNDTHDILYRLKVTEQQAAGEYETTITYIAVPVH